jgi:hypothetical protein
MKQELIDLYREVFNTLENCTGFLSKFSKGLTQGEVTLIDIADAIYGLRETKKLLEAFGSNINDIENVMIAIATKARDGEERTLRTEWVTITLRPEHHIPIPKKGSDDWNNLCDWLKLPRDCEAIKFSWDGLASTLEKRMAAGENSPIDITKLVTLYKATCRGKRDMLSTLHPTLEEEKKNDGPIAESPDIPF